jgi:hypothetical protein
MRSRELGRDRRRFGLSSFLEAVLLGASALVAIGCAGGASEGARKDATDPVNNPCSLETCGSVTRRPAPLPPPVCPLAEPTLGEPCPSDELECSYGGTVSTHCRHLFRCAEGQWQARERFDYCQSLPEQFCPAEPRHLADCTTGSFNPYVPCEYANAVSCYRFGPMFGGRGRWECFGPPQNPDCPEVIPNLGDGCEIRGQYCNYGAYDASCASPYSDVYCYEGAWEDGGGRFCVL